MDGIHRGRVSSLLPFMSNFHLSSSAWCHPRLRVPAPGTLPINTDVCHAVDLINKSAAGSVRLNRLQRSQSRPSSRNGCAVPPIHPDHEWLNSFQGGGLPERRQCNYLTASFAETPSHKSGQRRNDSDTGIEWSPANELGMAPISTYQSTAAAVLATLLRSSSGGPGIYHGLEELCVGFLDQAALQIGTFHEELLQENSAKFNQCRRGPAVGKERLAAGIEPATF
ncbi:hypothetical protein B0H10DRAFT_2192840 [Mycena sp. CBHHK59/15]|nr:hypothetical protein B0H10DRAFT_2192840 [Mycena sp. CBHHK59/15]